MLIPSPLEAKSYYAGIPSSPVLVARTGTTRWKPPTGTEADQNPKELYSVGPHPLKMAWGIELPLKVYALLDSMNAQWNTVDVVRIGKSEPYYVPLIHYAPVILWVGVKPGTLSSSDGVAVAFKCRKLLEENDITDVDVEIRETIVTHWPDFSTYDQSPPRSGKKKRGKKKYES